MHKRIRIFFHPLVIALGILGIAVSCTKESDSMKVTESGYEFKVCSDASGKAIETGEFAVLDLTIKSGDSTLQSSKSEPVPVMIKIEEDNRNYGKFAPVVDMIRTMSTGDSCVLYFPKDSFATNNPMLEPLADVLTYEVKLTDVMDEAAYQAFQDSVNQVKNEERKIVMAREADVATLVQEQFTKYQAGAINGLEKTESGLEYLILEEGDPGQPVNDGSFVKVHYYGALEADNTQFDNSFSRGAPIELTVGRGEVIPGWDEGLALLNEGSSAIFFIPFDLAYGKAGRPPVIPESADLMFFVEVDEVQK